MSATKDLQGASKRKKTEEKEEKKKTVLIHMFCWAPDGIELDRVLLNLKEETIQEIDNFRKTRALDYFESIIIPREADEETRLAVADPKNSETWETIKQWTLQNGPFGTIWDDEEQEMDTLKEQNLYRIYYWKLDEF